MRHFSTLIDPEIARLLRAGGVGVLRTDTLYGVVGRADNEAAVNRIYELKGRDETKSPIVLIASTDQLFDAPSKRLIEFTKTVWPGPVSVIMPSKNAPVWVRRNNASVAYRQPAKAELTSLIGITGALVAPSANPEGLPPASTIKEAASYFGDLVDFYVDDGEVLNANPSQLIRVHEDGSIERLR